MEWVYYLVSCLLGVVLGELIITIKTSWKLYGTLNPYSIEGKLIKKEHMKIHNKKY